MEPATVNEMRQAGFSEAEIMDQIVPQMKGAGFSDQEVYQHLVENKVPIDPYTGDLIPSFRAGKPLSFREQVVDVARDYLGIKPPRTTPLELEAIERGVSNYHVREEIFGGAAAEEFQKVTGRFLAGASFGATDFINTIIKGDENRPETMVGTGAGAVAELAGFLMGPFKMAGGITGGWLKPTVGGLRGTAEILAKGGATLGIASGLSSIIPAFLENDTFSGFATQVLKSAGMGTIVGALYPLAGYIPTAPLKVATTMAVMDLMRSGHGNWFTIDDTIKGIADGTIDKNVLAERSIQYLMDAYFALKAKPLREQLKLLEKNAVVKEVLSLTPDEIEQTIVELGERKLMPGARPRRVPGAKSDFLSAIIRDGGINPDFAQGEMARFAPKESKYPRLTSRKGLTPDMMLEKRIEDGRMPEGSTLNDMYDTMDRELRWVKNMKEIASRAPTEEDMAAQIAATPIETGPLWEGPAYRAEMGYTHEKGQTATDVVRYEQEELGNKLGITDTILAELKNHPASDLVWVTKTKEEATRFIPEGEGGKGEEYELPPGSRIIATDNEGGYLVLKGGKPLAPEELQKRILEEGPSAAQAAAEQAKATAQPIPKEAMDVPEVAQTVKEAGAMEALAETQAVTGEKAELADEKGDLRTVMPDTNFIKDILHYTGIKDKDPDGTTINEKDFIPMNRFLQMPFDVGMTHPEVAPIIDLQMARAAKKAALDQEFAEAMKPLFELPGESRIKVSKALIDSEVRDIELDAEALKKLGLSEKEIEGYRVVKENLRVAGGYILEVLHDLNAAPEVIADFEKQLSNYVPHKWYGNWVIRAVSEKGRTVDMWGVNYTERYRERDKMQTLYPGVKIVVQKRTQVPYEAFQEAPSYAVQKMVDLAMERAGATADMQDVVRQALGDLYKSKGFGMHFIRRKNVPGWEEDLTKPLAEYFSGLTGYLTKMDFMKQLPEAMRGMKPNRKPNLYRWAMDYVKYVTGDALEFKTAKNIAYFYYLWANVKSATMQITQNFILGWPVLSKHTDMALPKMAEAMAQVATGSLTPEQRAGAITVLEKGGYLEPQQMQEISGWVGHPIFKEVHGKAGKVIQGLDIFRHLERFNRQSMAVALYNAGIREPEKMAKLINEAHFWYGKGNRPVAMRGPVSPVMTFRSFFINYMTWLKNQAKAGAADIKAGGTGYKDFMPMAKSLLALTIFGGLNGLPLYKTVREAYIKLFGEDPETVASRYLGKRFGQIVMKGVPSQVGVDFSGSVGFGDILPTNLKELGGVFADVPDRAKKVNQALKVKDYARALEDASPEVLRNPLAALRLYNEGARSRGGRPVVDLTTGKPLKMTQAEAIKKAFGFYPMKFSEQYRMSETMDIIQQQRMERKQEWADRWNLARVNRNGAEMQKIAQEIRDYNVKMRQEGRPEDMITDREVSAMIRTRLRPINIPPKYMFPKLRKITEGARP